MNLVNGSAEVTVSKQTGTTIHLPTQDKYIDTDIEFSIEVSESSTAEGTAVTDVNIDATQGTNGVNIGEIVDEKSETEPNGYYIKAVAEGAGNSTVVTPGWIDAGELPVSTAIKTRYFSVAAAEANISGTNVLVPNVTIQGTNITLNNEDNGIYISATGGGTSTANVAVTSTAAGYMPSNTTIDTDTIITTETASTGIYLSGVALTLPEEGIRTFTITIPNGDDTVSLAFNVDPQGNITIN